jgi:hypothetical protein
MSMGGGGGGEMPIINGSLNTTVVVVGDGKCQYCVWKEGVCV